MRLRSIRTLATTCYDLGPESSSHLSDAAISSKITTQMCYHTNPPARGSQNLAAYAIGHNMTSNGLLGTHMHQRDVAFQCICTTSLIICITKPRVHVDSELFLFSTTEVAPELSAGNFKTRRQTKLQVKRGTCNQRFGS